MKLVYHTINYYDKKINDELVGMKLKMWAIRVTNLSGANVWLRIEDCDVNNIEELATVFATILIR